MVDLTADLARARAGGVTVNSVMPGPILTPRRTLAAHVAQQTKFGPDWAKIERRLPDRNRPALRRHSERPRTSADSCA